MTYILLFGITGDLSKRMLLPSLDNLIENKKINDIFIYGVSRRDLDVNVILNESLKEKASTSKLINNILGVKLSDDINEYIEFKKKLNLKDTDQLLIYLSVPPTSAMLYVELLGKIGLNEKNVKLMLEKPFGTNLATANEFLNVVNKYFNERQVYKIDHYLAKANAQAITQFKFNNKAVFNSPIDKIEIVAYETIDIQGRGVFYEQTGALRDFIQGHLMELLLLTIMENNSLNEADIIRNRIKAINSLTISNIGDCIRGQYDGYKCEVNNNSSSVETFANISLVSNLKEFSITKINLITGKSMDKKETSINIYFKHGSMMKIMVTPFEPLPNKITINSKIFNLKNDITQYLDGYKCVFYAAINSNKLPFVTNNEIITS
jgi:glucose-6-phosphate 1-dehydrogenase